MRTTTLRFTVHGRNLDELNDAAESVIKGLGHDVTDETRQRLDVAPLVMNAAGNFLWWTADVEVTL